MNRIPLKQTAIIFILSFGLLGVIFNTINHVEIHTMTGNIDRGHKNSRNAELIETQISAVEDARIGISTNAEFSGNLMKAFWFSLFLILGIVFLYLRFINSKEMRRFVDHHLKAAGFSAKLPRFSRSIYIPNMFYMEIKGMKRLQVLFSIPYYSNFLEFGLHQIHNYVVADTSIDMIGLKLLTIHAYIKSN